MNSNPEHIRKLQEKLNGLEPINPENHQKIRLTQIQETFHKLSQDCFQEEELSALKVKETIDFMKKIESRLK